LPIFFANSGHQVNFVASGEYRDYTLFIDKTPAAVIARGWPVNPDTYGVTPAEDNGMVRDLGFVFKDNILKRGFNDPNVKRRFENNPALIGRAMGTAGAHEIGHYLLQQAFDSRRILGIMNGRGPKDMGWLSFTSFNSYQNLLLNRRCAPVPLSTDTIIGGITSPGGGGGGGDFGGGYGGGYPFWWYSMWAFVNWVNSIPVDRYSELPIIRFLEN
jgi:hypothetical protein